MLHEDPCVQDGITCVPAPEIGVIATNESTPSLSKAEIYADRSNTQHPEIPGLSRWLQHPEVCNDANDANDLDELDGSDGSDGSDMSEEPDASNESEASYESDEYVSITSEAGAS